MSPSHLFMIGAPKCGTTALYTYLGAHPNVYFPREKEPHFFADDFPTHRTCTDWTAYQKLYDAVEPHHAVVGDASVMMLYSQTAVRQALSSYPDARFLISLRNPIDLVVSLHRQFLLSGREREEDFASAWRRERQSEFSEHILHYPRFGQLGTYLSKVAQQIPAGQLCVTYLDDLRLNPRAAYLRLLHFLDLHDDGQGDFAIVNEARQHRWPWLSRLVLDRPCLVASLKRLGVSRALRYFGSTPAVHKEISQDLKQELLDYYREEIGLLGELTQRDLSPWLRGE